MPPLPRRPFASLLTHNNREQEGGGQRRQKRGPVSLRVSYVLALLVGGSSRMSKERAGSSSSSTTKQTRLQNTEKHNSCRVSHSCCSLTHSLTHSLSLSLCLSVSLSLSLWSRSTEPGLKLSGFMIYAFPLFSMCKALAFALKVRNLRASGEHLQRMYGIPTRTIDSCQEPAEKGSGRHSTSYAEHLLHLVMALPLVQLQQQASLTSSRCCFLLRFPALIVRSS